MKKLDWIKKYFTCIRDNKLITFLDTYQSLINKKV